MKKLFVAGLALLLVTTAFGQMTVLWEKTAVNGTMPTWFDATGSLTRGLAYGVVGGQERLYVATRNGGNLVYSIDPATGDTLGRLNTTGISGGTLVLNDVEVSADGIIFVCNLKTVSATDTVFKVYKWTSEAAAPEVAISYVNKDMRLGDKITVTGSASDNSLVIWAASATTGQNKVVKFTTTDNGATFTPTIVNIDAAGGSASVGPLPDGSFYWNAGGANPKKYAADGTLIGGIPGSVVATGSTAIRYIATVNGCEFFTTHQYGTGNENARIVKVPMGDPTKAVTYAITPSQRVNANSNGTGDVAVKNNGNGTFTVYVLSTNNGYGAYVIDPRLLSGDYFIPQGVNAQGFNTLGDAIAALNNGGTAAPVRFLIDDNLNELGSNLIITRNDLSAAKPVVVKPAPGKTPSITITSFPTTGNHAKQGLTIENASYITIDGSNTEGGTTKDLTIIGNDAVGVYVVGVIDNSDFITIKNVKITYNSMAASGTLLGVDGYTGVPNKLLIENCDIGSPEKALTNGVALWGNDPTTLCEALVKDCNIYATRRGITTYYNTHNAYINNTISIVNPRADQTFYAGIYVTGFPANDTCLIANNRILGVPANTSTSKFSGGVVIYGNEGVVQIQNNFIATNFTNAGTNTANRVYGIVFGSATWIGTAEVINNTIVVNSTNQTGVHAAIGTEVNSSARLKVVNNLLINNHDAANSFSIHWTNTPSATSELRSDYNDIYLAGASAKTGKYGATEYATLAEWQTGTSQDLHSVSKAVNFVSNLDLHLTGASIGDNDLGCPNFGVPTDIDGDPRPSFTYMGADEAAVKLVPQIVKVTFIANTAGVPDTLQANHTVQIRGFWPFTWDNNSPGIMTNIDGDYWSYTIELPRDSLTRPIEYKFCTFPVEPSALTAEMNGWEAGGNRILDLTTFEESDTTLPLQFVRGWSGSAGQFEAPFEVTDSIDVFLRVNMEALVKAQAFNPETEFVGVRGSNAWGDWSGTPDFNWGSTHRFEKENNHANGIWGSTYNGTYFWNGVLHLPPDWAGKEIQYKFLIGDAWGRDESNNRSLILPADGSDVTVHWVWFNNVPPAGFTGKDTADITFYADLSKAIANNGFEIGDTLLVKYGYFGSSVEVKTATMVRQTGTQNYFVTVEDVPLSFGKPLYYQYYLVKSGQEQREVYFNFDYTGSVPSEAERRAFVVESPTPVIADIVDSDVDARRMPVFRNNKLLGQPVAVTVECDIRPAVYQVKAGSTLNDIQSGIHITPEMLTADPDTIFKLGVYINGPMSNNGEGTWVTWGGTLASDPNRKMWDDGTHGDAVAGDSIYTVVYNFDPSLGHRVGQEFKFGIGGGDNESGYGLNHIENINDANATYVMHNQWGSINPKFYNAWNFDLRRPATAVREEGIPVVTKYALEQNFPNPFNPTTQIRFAIPEPGEVHLTIYNALGQVVNRVVFSNLNMGVYSYIWDGKDLRGNNVASGIYFYELRAGNKFRDLKKMVLMK